MAAMDSLSSSSENESDSIRDVQKFKKMRFGMRMVNYEIFMLYKKAMIVADSDNESVCSATFSQPIFLLISSKSL